MKKFIIAVSALAVVLSLSACGKEEANPTDTEAEKTVSQTEYDISETVSASESENDSSEKTTQAKTTESKTEGSSAKPDENQHPSTYTGTTVTDTFIITKVSGTYLELRKVIGNDTEKLLYCCSLGDMTGTDDMQFKVGDGITLRYDAEIAETYPLQLTVREIFPAAKN